VLLQIRQSRAGRIAAGRNIPQGKNASDERTEELPAVSARSIHLFQNRRLKKKKTGAC